jgi:hypothetical protein
MIFLPKNHVYYRKLLVFLFLVISFCTTAYATVSQHEYIIEFSSTAQTNLFIKNHQNDIVKVRYRYDSDILTGAAVEFTNEKVAKSLVFHHSDIIKAWPIHHRIRQQAPMKKFKNEDNLEDENNGNVATFVPQNNVKYKAKN